MDIVPIFKALADETRIQIMALLSVRELSVEELASAVELTAPTVSHHLARLREVRLVEARHEQYYTVYRFSKQPLFDALRAVADGPAKGAVAEDLARYDRKVIGDYLVDGKLKTIPAQRKKREVILRLLAERFETGRSYPEKDVNLIIAEYHDDFATLRRELISYKLLERQNGIYTRVS